MSAFLCLNCGEQTQLYYPVCAKCGANHSMTEIPDYPLTATDGQAPRLSTGRLAIDRVLGGGLVIGSMIVLGGPPGVGKSTFALQIAASVEPFTKPSLYVATEEQPERVIARAQRMDIAAACQRRVRLVSTRGGLVIGDLQRDLRPPLTIVDSLNMVVVPDTLGVLGGPAQMKATVAHLRAVPGTWLLLAHVRESGQLAGPRTVQHLVDVVLYLEPDPARGRLVLRAEKNRFGAITATASLRMTERGLAVEGP